MFSTRILHVKSSLESIHFKESSGSYNLWHMDKVRKCTKLSRKNITTCFIITNNEYQASPHGEGTGDEARLKSCDLHSARYKLSLPHISLQIMVISLTFKMSSKNWEEKTWITIT